MADSRVLVAVSGGADSVAACRGLHQLRDTLGLELIAAHVNHQLRGQESDADAEWVAKWCDQLGIPCEVRRINVERSAERSTESLEEAARRCRYATLIEVAIEQRCSAIVVGHQADDLAETILHHIIRGTGLSGLRGMPRTRLLATNMTDDGSLAELRLVRPLLEISRTVIEDWLTQIQQTYREDASNTDARFTRNRLRHELLPVLERDFNPQIRKALISLAIQADETSAWLIDQAKPLVDAALLDGQTNILRINCDALKYQPKCIVREVLLQCWRKNQWPMQRMGFQQWQQLAELVTQQSGSINLPGAIVAKRRGTILVMER